MWRFAPNGPPGIASIGHIGADSRKFPGEPLRPRLNAPAARQRASAERRKERTNQGSLAPSLELANGRLWRPPPLSPKTHKRKRRMQIQRLQADRCKGKFSPFG